MKRSRLIGLEVHVGTPIDKCREINNRLLEEVDGNGGYPKEIFENLILRYEEPNGMNRWDSPLFTVPYKDETSPFEAIWEAVIGSDGKSKVIRPNLATVNVRSRTCNEWLRFGLTRVGSHDRFRLSV